MVAGPPFLLVHGLASNALLWTGVATHLAAAGALVVAIDQRSHGRSDPSDALGWGTLTRDLLTVASGLALERPVVVGQSWGGNVVLELGRRHPTHVGGVACVDGGWIELSSRFPDWESCWSVLAPPRLEGAAYGDVAAAMAARHVGWPADATAAQLANVAVTGDGLATPILTRDRHETILRHLWAHRPSELWADIDVPVLLMPALGGDDAETRRAVAEAERLLPRGRTHAFPDRHHDVHVQDPTAVATALLDAVTTGFFGERMTDDPPMKAR